jgi:hypothetical protein
MFWLLLSTQVFAADCISSAESVWAFYADEWGHEEKPVQALIRKNINIGSMSGQWMYLPQSCTKDACQVSFLLKDKACWKPLVSVEGKINSIKPGDWSRFKHRYNSSSINKDKNKEIVWTFDSKEKKFKQTP